MKKLIYSLLFLIFISPIFLLILYSIALGFSYPNLLPENYSFRGLELVFSSSSMKITFFSILSALTVTLFTLLLCIPAARAIAIGDFKGKYICYMLLTSPLILPLSSITMGIHLIFIKLNLTNTFLGIVLINALPCIPYCIRLLVNVMSIVSNTHETVARTLGASPFKAFIKITLPLIIPGILSASTLVFIIAFSQYFTTFLIGGGNIVTLPMVLIPYIQSGDRTLASSYSLLFIFSSMAVLLIIEKLLYKHYKGENSLYI